MKKFSMIAALGLFLCAGIVQSAPQQAPAGGGALIGSGNKTGFYAVHPKGKLRLLVVRDAQTLAFLYQWHINGQSVAPAAEKNPAIAGAASDLTQEGSSDQTQAQMEQVRGIKNDAVSTTTEAEVPANDNSDELDDPDEDDDFIGVQNGDAGQLPTELSNIDFDEKMVVVAIGYKILSIRPDRRNTNTANVTLRTTGNRRSYHVRVVNTAAKVFFGRKRADEATLNSLLREDIELRRSYGSMTKVSAEVARQLSGATSKIRCPNDRSRLTLARPFRQFTVRYCENERLYYGKDTVLNTFYGPFKPGLYR